MAAERSRRAPSARPSVPFNVNFPLPLYERLWAGAERAKLSASEFIRRAVSESLRDESEEPASRNAEPVSAARSIREPD